MKALVFRKFWIVVLSTLIAVLAIAFSSPLPADAQGSGATATVTAWTLNVRYGPGTTYQVVGQVSRGQVVQLDGYRNSDASWVQIRAQNGMYGWVSAYYLRSSYAFSNLPVHGGTAPAPSSSSSSTGGSKWIDVNLSTQTIRAYEGNTVVYWATVSTGRQGYETVTGRYNVWVKLRYDDMTGGSRERGDYYYLEDVPYVMYFFRGYGIHGTYWHNNFGTPMSAGCVNLTIADAQWFYNWASVGTPVNVHY